MMYFVILLITNLHASTGSIVVEVIDADTHQPIIGANVIIVDTKLGIACNNEGRFFIDNIPGSPNDVETLDSAERPIEQ